MSKIFKNPFVWAFFLGIISLHIIKNLALARRSAPEPLVYVGDWSLTDHNNQILSSKNLKNKILIADYFFTSCPTICPKLTNAMKQVHERLQTEQNLVEFLSITVDPETDTPERLNKFMQENNLVFNNWHALTGTKQEIYQVVVNQMRVHMGDKQDAHTGYDIPHLAQLALFDQQGNLRGLFKTEPVELAALVRAAKFLLE